MPRTWFTTLDLSERLLVLLNPALLLLYALFYCLKLLNVGARVCWAPPEFTLNMVQYSLITCGNQTNVWVKVFPLLLAGMAVLAILPLAFWRECRNHIQLRLENFITPFPSTIDNQSRLERAAQLKRCIRAHLMSDGICGTGNSATLVYLCLVRKALVTLSVLLQLLIVCWLGGLFTERFSAKSFNWPLMESLNRYSLCDFNLMHLGSFRTYTLNCESNLHLTTQGILISLFFWNLLCLILIGRSLVVFALKNLSSWSQLAFVKWCIYCSVAGSDSVAPACGQLQQQVLDVHLRSDGVFALRLLAQHDVFVAAEVVQQLVQEHTHQQAATAPALAVGGKQQWSGDVQVAEAKV